MIRIILLFFLCCVLGCKYKLSTYSADTPDQKLNESNLMRIKIQETTTASDFKVALVSDTHNYYKDLEDLIKEINQRGPYSFVIICGDITNLGLLEEYDLSRRFFNRLQFPYLVSVGNHDLLANGKIIFKKMFGKSNFSFTFKGTQFVFFDNNNWENDGNIPDENWVSDTLSDPVPSQRILIAHIPPGDRDRFTPAEINEWIDLVNNMNVDYFINGHNHNPVESTFGNATNITVGAPSKRNYYELIISAGGIQHQKIDF